MCRAMSIAGAGGPDTSQYKHRHKNQKKDSCNFEPEDSANAAEGAEETAQAAAHGSPGLERGAGSRLAGVKVPVPGAGNQSGGMHLQTSRRGLGRNRQTLPGNASGDADCDAQSAADPVSSHTVYDGSNGLERFAPSL